MKNQGSSLRAKTRARLIFVVIIVGLIAVSFTATALMKSNDGRQAKVNSKVSPNQKSDPTADFWQEVFGTPTIAQSDQQATLQPRRFRALTLNRGAMERALAGAPREFTAAAQQANFVLALPAPDGAFQRFAVWESSVMEAGLAEKHPDIKTYAGRGIDDRSATLRFDLTPSVSTLRSRTVGQLVYRSLPAPRSKCLHELFRARPGESSWTVQRRNRRSQRGRCF